MASLTVHPGDCGDVSWLNRDISNLYGGGLVVNHADHFRRVIQDIKVALWIVGDRDGGNKQGAGGRTAVAIVGTDGSSADADTRNSGDVARRRPSELADALTCCFECENVFVLVHNQGLSDAEDRACRGSAVASRCTSCEGIDRGIRTGTDQSDAHVVRVGDNNRAI